MRTIGRPGGTIRAGGSLVDQSRGSPPIAQGVVSVSDPDSQRMKANLGYVQSYNAQAVVDQSQVVLAAELTNTPGDFSNLDPMITAGPAVAY